MTENTIDLIYHIEALAANAWPPAVMQIIDGWRLRFTWNVTRRANSVWPNGAGSRQHLADKMTWVEEFYRRWGSPPRYQICPAVQPADLDQMLADRGYTTDARTAVQIASLSRVLARTEDAADFSVTVAETFDEAWFAAYCEAEEVGEQAAQGRRNILERIGPRVGYALLHLEGVPVGMGLAVVERGWLGIFSMATQVGYRRRGVATAVLQALAHWGEAHQAHQVYLQVMENNTTAQALYRKIGFETLYHYHYRQLDQP